MKILLCHNFYQQTGGEDTAVLALRSLLEEKGHQVIFYTEHSQEVEKFNAFQKIRFFPRTIFSLHSYRRLRQIVARESPEIAHIHNVFPLMSPAVYVALSRSRIPIVQTIHNYRLMCVNGLFLRDGRICELCKSGNFLSGIRFKCYRNSYTLSTLYAATIGSHRSWGTFKRIDRFIALSHFAATKMVESGVADESKISVLENFLPTPLPDYGDSDLTNPYIVYMGRLSHEKGIFTLLEALRALTSLRLKVLGTGPLREAMETYIRAHRLPNVEMLGFINGEEKYQILRGALCCVVPSECYENLPYVALESAAVGTPVVASRIGGLPAIISDEETGLLFTHGNSSELREKIESLVDNPELVRRIGQRARQQAETRYTPGSHYEKLMNIYDDVVRPLRMVTCPQNCDGVPSSND